MEEHCVSLGAMQESTEPADPQMVHDQGKAFARKVGCWLLVASLCFHSSLIHYTLQ